MHLLQDLDTICINLNLTLTDLSGKSLYNISKSGNHFAGEKINVRLQSLAKGVYVLKIQTDKGTGTEKILLQ